MSTYTHCIKCGMPKDTAAECPYCGVFYAKAEQAHQDQLRAAAERLRTEWANESAPQALLQQSVLGGDHGPPEILQYWGSAEPVTMDAKLRISYRSYHGESTERDIHVTRYDGSCYMRAYCWLRNESRTFRIDRILSCVDIDTGEVVDHVPDHLLAKYRSSPEYALSKAFEVAWDILLVLFYVGKADGQLRAEERVIICKVARRAANNESITDEMINKELDRMSVPSPGQFKLALNRICKKNPRNMIGVFNIARRIVDTQKTIHPSEAEAIAYIEKKMAKEGISVQ